MLTIGLLLLVIGVAATIGCFFWRRSSERTSGWWSAVADIDIATALDAGDGTAVAVTGVTVAPATQDGPLLQDPVHGETCCWWRVTVTEHWEERVHVTRTKDDTGPEHRWEDRDHQLSERLSALPFVLEDGGRITVTLTDLDLDDELLQSRAERDRPDATADSIAESVLDSLVKTTDDRRNEYTETRVQILPAGVRALAAGRMAGTTLVADEEHRLQVRKGTVEEHLGASRKSAGRARAGLFAGLGLTAAGLVVTVVGALA